MKIKNATFVVSNTDYRKCPPPEKPEYAFVGRSNVGKSSLINMLTGNGKLAKASVQPGKTQLINHFDINGDWYLVDLPGYGYARMGQKGRDELAAVIRDYIRNSEEMVLLFVLIDSRHDIGRIDLDFLAELGENGVPFALIMTKCDKQGPNVLAAQIARDRGILLEQWEELPPVFCTSSLDGRGKEEVLDYIDGILQTL